MREPYLESTRCIIELEHRDLVFPSDKSTNSSANMLLLLKSSLLCSCFTVQPIMMLIQATEATASVALTAIFLQYV